MSIEESFLTLFPEGTRPKDVQDALSFLLASFDSRHPRYNPATQESALAVARETLGVTYADE